MCVLYLLALPLQVWWTRSNPGWTDLCLTRLLIVRRSKLWQACYHWLLSLLFTLEISVLCMVISCQNIRKTEIRAIVAPIKLFWKAIKCELIMKPHLMQ